MTDLERAHNKIDYLQHLLDEQKLNYQDIKRIDLVGGSSIVAVIRKGKTMEHELYIPTINNSVEFHSSHILLSDALRTWRLFYYGV
jgi:hypothetical protein